MGGPLTMYNRDVINNIRDEFIRGLHVWVQPNIDYNHGVQ